MCGNKSGLDRLQIMLPTDYTFVNHIYLIYIYIQDLPLNNLQGTLTSPTTLSQIEPGSNGNKRVLRITQISRTGA